MLVRLTLMGIMFIVQFIRRDSINYLTAPEDMFPADVLHRTQLMHIIVKNDGKMKKKREKN